MNKKYYTAYEFLRLTVLFIVFTGIFLSIHIHDTSLLKKEIESNREKISLTAEAPEWLLDAYINCKEKSDVRTCIIEELNDSKSIK